MDTGLIILLAGVVVIALIFIIAAASKTEHRDYQATAPTKSGADNTASNPAAGWLRDSPPPSDARGSLLRTFGDFRLHTNVLRYGDHEQPLSGLTATVEATGAVTKRTTATRVIVGAVAFGGIGAVVGATAKKRVDGRELYLHVDGPSQYWVEPVDPRQGSAARQFAAEVMTAVKASSAPQTPATPEVVDHRLIRDLGSAGHTSNDETPRPSR